MTKAELITDIYRRLPPDAQREAIDFLLRPALCQAASGETPEAFRLSGLKRQKGRVD